MTVTLGLRIVLPWPPVELGPNRRLHWAAKAKAAGSYRRACLAQAIEHGARFKAWEGEQ